MPGRDTIALRTPRGLNAAALHSQGLRFWPAVGSRRIVGSRRLLLLLVSLDAALLLGHVAVRAGLTDGEQLLVTTDGGVPELFQYLKLAAAALTAAAIAMRIRERWLAAFVLLFGYALVDDAVQFHEWIGGRVAATASFSPGLGMRAEDFGELAVFGAIAIVTVGLLLVLPRPRELSRRLRRDLVVLAAALAFFAAAVDVLHQMVGRWIPGIGIVEDGGEMFIVSLIVWRLVAFYETRSRFVLPAPRAVVEHGSVTQSSH